MAATSSASAPPPLSDAVVDPLPIAPASAQDLAGGMSLYSLGELRLTAVIFAFGLIAMFLFYLILRHDKATPFVLRMYVIIILVFGTLLIVSSAYTTAQIAPVVGFFGTIAGYLLGRSDQSSAPRNDGGSDEEKR